MRRLYIGLLLALAFTLTACASEVAVPKATVPVGTARMVPWQVGVDGNFPAERAIVTHPEAGWHVFLAVSPETGQCMPGGRDRTLRVRHPKALGVDQIWHGCSGTIWNLDGKYVFGPSSGVRDEWLIPLNFRQDRENIYIPGPASQDVWRYLTSTTPVPIPGPYTVPAPDSTPLPAPTPTGGSAG